MTNANNAAALAELAALAAELEAEGVDLNEARGGGGGDYVPPAEGACRVRLVGYVEVGTHTETSRQFGSKTKPRCELTFELSGPKHAPKEIDGVKYPHRVVIRESIGFHEKNGYLKLFKLLNTNGTAKNFLQLVGQPFRATVVHRKYVGADGKERISAGLKSDQGYTFQPVTYEDPETNELRTIKVDEALTPIKYLIWDRPTLAQWDGIFIDGAYDDGGSKNKLQEKCASAENFIGSALHALLVENDRPIPVAKPRAPKAGADALAAAPETGDDNPAVGAEPAKAVPPAKPAAPKAAAKPPAAAPAAAKTPAKGKVATGAVDPLAGV